MKLTNRSWLLKVSFILKSFILIGILIFIILKLEESIVPLRSLPDLLVLLFQKQSLWLLLLPICLTIVNWALEAIKWKFLVAKIEKITFAHALKGVLTGVSLGFITPHALGDYAGRVWQLQHKRRLDTIGAIMLGRALQYFATFTFGIVGVCYLLFDAQREENFFFWSVIGVAVTFALGVSIIVNWRTGFLKFLDFIGLAKLKKYFYVIAAYTPREILFFIGLAFARYAVFAVQFLFLLLFFEVSAEILFLLAGISWTFFAKSSIPAFNFLSDLGVREFSALYFFSQFQVSEIHVVMASFALWVVNILFPALLGLFGVISMKIFRTS